MKKKRIFLIALGAVLAAALGGTGFYFRNLIFHYGEIRQIMDTNETFAALLSSENYQDADIEERKVQVEALLDELVQNGVLMENSVGYCEESQTFGYQYADGIIGVVEIGEQSELYPAYGTVPQRNYSTVERNVSGTDCIVAENNRVEFNTDIYPYNEEEISARMMHASGKNWLETLVHEQAALWESEHMSTRVDTECTIEEFKSRLDNDNYLNIAHHGVFYNDTPTIAVEGEFSLVPFSVKYYDDLKNGRMWMYNSSFDYLSLTRKGNFCLTPAFIRHYYSGDQLENTIVWLSCCNGYKNDKLVSAFAQCGAKAVIGASDSVLMPYDYNMQDAFVYSLLYGDTVQEALDYAKTIYGSDDNMWCVRFANTSKPGAAAEFKLYNGGNATLVTLSEELVLENDAAESVVQSGGVTLSLTESYISLSPGESYQLKVASLPDNISVSDLIWQTDKPEVVTVDANGSATAVADGVATITVKTPDEIYAFRCTVNVYPK